MINFRGDKMNSFTNTNVGDVAYNIFVVSYFRPEECFITLNDLYKTLDALHEEGIDPNVVVHLFDTDHNLVTTMTFDDYQEKIIGAFD